MNYLLKTDFILGPKYWKESQLRSLCIHGLLVSNYQVYFHCNFYFFFLTNTSPFSPLFSITVETVVRSSVMPVRTMNCLCLLRQSLFVSVIPAMQYLYRGALLMCPKILLQVIYQFLVFS